MSQIKIQSGTKAVIGWTQDGTHHVRLYVNVKDGQDSTATLTANKFKTMAGVQKWAAKVLAR